MTYDYRAPEVAEQLAAAIPPLSGDHMINPPEWLKYAPALVRRTWPYIEMERLRDERLQGERRLMRIIKKMGSELSTIYEGQGRPWDAGPYGLTAEEADKLW